MLRPLAATTFALVGLVFLATVAGCTRERSAALGFWFEPVTYRSARFADPVTTEELEIIARVARGELTRAFAGLRVAVSDRQDAR